MKTLDPDGNPAQDAPPDDKPTWGDCRRAGGTPARENERSGRVPAQV